MPPYRIYTTEFMPVRVPPLGWWWRLRRLLGMRVALTPIAYLTPDNDLWVHPANLLWAQEALTKIGRPWVMGDGPYLRSVSHD